MPDLGNPNFYTTFKGRYTVTPAEGVAVDNDTVMLTSNNIVCMCGDFEPTDYKLGDVFATLPPECRPDTTVYAIVPADCGSVIPTVMEAGVDGALRIVFPDFESMSSIKLSGAVFSMNQTIYKPMEG